MLGKKLLIVPEQNLSEGKNRYSFSVKDFTEGIYFITVRKPENEISRKIIITR